MCGYVDEYLQPKVKLLVRGLRQESEVEAVVDTGFNGDLCLPISLAIQLGLELWGDQYVELADGSIKHEFLFRGEAILEQSVIPVEISLTESEDALLGVGLLKDQKLEIGFATGTVNIGPEIL